MTVDTTKVRVAITGAVSVAVPGTAAPTDASTALIAAYKDLGAISEDGVTESGSRSTNDIKIWQHGAVARTVITDASLTFQYTMVETNQRTQVEYYGATYNSTTKSMIIDPANSGGRKPHVIDVIDGTNLKRIYARTCPGPGPPRRTTSPRGPRPLSTPAPSPSWGSTARSTSCPQRRRSPQA
jgi:hypothetical protein